MQAPLYGVVRFEGEFRRVPEVQRPSQAPSEEPGRRLQAGEDLLHAPWASRRHEEDAGVTQICAHSHGRDDQIVQSGVLDLTQERLAQLFLDQTGNPVGSFER